MGIRAPREPLSPRLGRGPHFESKISSHLSKHPTSMRLFLSLPIPPELAQALTRLTRAIELPKGRRTAPENLHLTLVFLGEVAEPTRGGFQLVQHGPDRDAQQSHKQRHDIVRLEDVPQRKDQT